MFDKTHITACGVRSTVCITLQIESIQHPRGHARMQVPHAHMQRQLCMHALDAPVSLCCMQPSSSSITTEATRNAQVYQMQGMDHGAVSTVAELLARPCAPMCMHLIRRSKLNHAWRAWVRAVAVSHTGYLGAEAAQGRTAALPARAQQHGAVQGGEMPCVRIQQQGCSAF